MQAKRENIIRKIDFTSICTESSTKFPAGFGSIIGDMWEIYGLSVAIRFLVFSFRFCRRDSEPLLKEHLNTCKKSMLLFYFPLNCFSQINKKNNTLLLEQIVLKDLVPLSLPYFLAALKSFLRNAIFISCVLIHLPPSS